MIKKLMQKTGALQKGHFLLASGLHSEYYFQAQALLENPEDASKTGSQVAALWKDEPIDCAVSLATGGIIIGHETARHLNVRHIFLERKKGVFTLKRNFKLSPGERILLVEDVITTGGSLKEAIKALEKYRPEIIGITSILSRGNANFNYPLKALKESRWPTYKPRKCPLCKKGIKLNAPGTKQSSG